MSNKSIDALIDDLTDELEPRKPLPHPVVRTFPWAVISFTYLAVIIQVSGLRPDLVHKFHDVNFIFELGLSIFIAVSAFLASAYWCVPDARGKKWLVSLPLMGSAIFIFWNAIRFIIEENARMPDLHWNHCYKDGLAMAILPIASIVIMCRQGKTTCSATMMSMNIIAITSVAYIGLRFTCMLDTVGHSGIAHILPFSIVTTIMGFATHRLYKW